MATATQEDLRMQVLEEKLADRDATILWQHEKNRVQSRELRDLQSKLKDSEYKRLNQRRMYRKTVRELQRKLTYAYALSTELRTKVRGHR
jgi:hypothetical protein